MKDCKMLVLNSGVRLISISLMNTQSCIFKSGFSFDEKKNRSYTEKSNIHDVIVFILKVDIYKLIKFNY